MKKFFNILGMLFCAVLCGIGVLALLEKTNYSFDAIYTALIGSGFYDYGYKLIIAISAGFLGFCIFGARAASEDKVVINNEIKVPVETADNTETVKTAEATEEKPKAEAPKPVAPVPVEAPKPAAPKAEAPKPTAPKPVTPAAPVAPAAPKPTAPVTPVASKPVAPATPVTPVAPKPAAAPIAPQPAKAAETAPTSTISALAAWAAETSANKAEEEKAVEITPTKVDKREARREEKAARKEEKREEKLKKTTYVHPFLNYDEEESKPATPAPAAKTTARDTIEAAIAAKANAGQSVPTPAVSTPAPAPAPAPKAEAPKPVAPVSQPVQTPVQPKPVTPAPTASAFAQPKPATTYANSYRDAVEISKDFSAPTEPRPAVKPVEKPVEEKKAEPQQNGRTSYLDSIMGDFDMTKNAKAVETVDNVRYFDVDPEPAEKKEEYKAPKVLPNTDWKCPNCKRWNASYIGTCACGNSRC